MIINKLAKSFTNMHLTLVVENDLYFMFANKHSYQTILLKTLTGKHFQSLI